MKPPFNLNFNERRILEFLRINGPTSRADLARQANLKAPTVTNLTANLLKIKLICEVSIKRIATPGQPSKLLDINPKGVHTVGIAITPYEINMCVVDLLGKIIADATQTLDSNNVNSVLEIVVRLFDKLLTETKFKKSKILGCGVTIPESFSATPPFILHIHEFKSWEKINFGNLFKERLGVEVWHDNDGNATALAEAHYGVSRRFKNFVNIYLSYGIGGGVVINRKLYRGALGNAAEFGGFFPHDEDRPSGSNLVAFLRKKGLHYNSLSELGDSEKHRSILEPWLEKSTLQLIHLITIIHFTFDPEAIICGGILPDWIMKDLVERINSASLKRDGQNILTHEIISSEFNEQSQHLVAASIPLYYCFGTENYNGRALKGW